MSKLIKVTREEKVVMERMSPDEMLRFFDNMINDFTHECLRKNCGYQESVNDFEDYKQILSIRAIDAYNNYDSYRATNFSTVLHVALTRGVIDEIRRNESQIRKSIHQKVYIDAPIGENGETSVGLIPDTKEVGYFEEDSCKLERFLCENMTKEEMIYCVVDCTKRTNKASETHKSCLGYIIDVFRREIGFEFPTKKEELAVMLNVSRPTLNKRIKEAMMKLLKLGLEYGLDNLTLAELNTLEI